MPDPLEAKSSNGLKRRWLPSRPDLAFIISSPLLTGAAVLTGLLIPMLLSPELFGVYALVTTLVSYTWLLDLGLVPLLDRKVPTLMGQGEHLQARELEQHVLWMRLYIAAAVAVAAGPTLKVLNGLGVLDLPLAPSLCAVGAGLGYMLATGPRAIYRARSQTRAFTLSSVGIELGQSLPRLAGLLVGGVTGIFVALSVWYGLAALVLMTIVRPRKRTLPSRSRCWALLRESMPLFTAKYLWNVYLTVNRWFALSVCTPVELGHFALGTATIVLFTGLLGTVSQLYCPRMVRQIAGSPPLAWSRTIARDLSLLATAATGLAAVGIALLPPVIGRCYPQYVGAIGTAQIMMLAGIPMTVASWIFPLSLSAGEQPWLDAVIVYPPAIGILGTSVLLGYRVGGIEGMAWGCLASAMTLVALQLVLLRKSRILGSLAAIVLFGVVTSLAVTAAIAYSTICR